MSNPEVLEVFRPIDRSIGASQVTGIRSPLKSHRFSDPRNSVSLNSLELIIHGNHDDSFVEIIILSFLQFIFFKFQNRLVQCLALVI
jgi:hypothetical protein